jgi:hypothetical protein
VTEITKEMYELAEELLLVEESEEDISRGDGLDSMSEKANLGEELALLVVDAVNRTGGLRV